MSLWKWSQTAASNATADTTINWQEGQSPRTINDSARAMMAAIAKFRDDLACKAVTGGTSTAYTLTTNQTLTSLSDGLVIGFEVHTDCGASPTLNADSTGAVTLSPLAGIDFAAGQLKAGGKYVATYDATGPAWVVQGFAIPSIGQGGTGSTLTDPAADRILFWDESASAVTWLAPSTGLAISGTNIALSHLGIEALTDPGADRIAFWDDSGSATAWLEPSNGVAISGTKLALDINGLTETVPNPAADYLPFYDDSGTTNGKVRLDKIGGRRLLATLTASSSVSLSDTTSLTSTYRNYIIEFDAVIPATNNTQFRLTISTDGGSNYEATSYTGSNLTIQSSGATTGANSVTTALDLTPAIVSNSSSHGIHGWMQFFNPSGSSTVSPIMGEVVYADGTAARRTSFNGYWNGATTAINAIKFAFSSGNITSGTIRIYGVLA